MHHPKQKEHNKNACVHRYLTKRRRRVIQASQRGNADKKNKSMFHHPIADIAIKNTHHVDKAN
jgi:hypothetical protein